MATILVVANETLASHSLTAAVKERDTQPGDDRFIIVAPRAQAASGLVSYDDVLESATEARIDAMIDQLRKDGIEAAGEVMDPDPFSAVMDAVGAFSPDEIIISTHPETRSGWLGQGLLERVQQQTGLPVHHVVVDLDAERSAGTVVLVVANETVGGGPLLETLREKAAQGPHRFLVLVPQAGKFGEHAQEARTRLGDVVAELRAEGLDVQGSIGDPDPYTAISNALAYAKVDEIVISTFPETKSGWLRTDLIERVGRSTAVPVEHVVVDAEQAAEGAAAAHQRAA